MVTKMSPLNRYFPLVGLETRLSSVFRPYCYVVLLLFSFVLVVVVVVGVVVVVVVVMVVVVGVVCTYEICNM